MIGRILKIWKTATVYVASHLHILIVLVLLFVFPFLFIYSGQQFLDAGRANQERLQKDRISTLHDAFELLITTLPEASGVWQEQTDKIVSNESEISLFVIQKREGNVLHTVAASDETIVGATSTLTDWHTGAAVRPETTMVYKVSNKNSNDWYTYRLVQTTAGEEYFIASIHSMLGVEQLFAARERTAYWSLLFVYLLVGALAVWHYFLTDFKRLYEVERERNQVKDRFFYTVAHELRSPLTAIKGFSSLQTETKSSEEIQTYAKKIQTTSKRTLLLIDDLLDVARIQSGKLSLSPKQLKLYDVVLSVVAELEPVATKQNLKLNNHVSKDEEVFADQDRFKQVLVNLVNNSLKYTKDGSITITAETKRLQVEIRIADTGTGIESSDQRKLFTPFFRTHSADSGSVVGTGLGMWITQELIRQMQGTIGVESIKDVGTHVVVTLPKASPRV